MKDIINKKKSSHFNTFLVSESTIKKKKKISHLYLKYVLRKAMFYFTIFFIIISMLFLLSRLYIQFNIDDIYSSYTIDVGFFDEDLLLAMEAELERIMGIGKPLWEAYIDFIIQVFTFDFGSTPHLNYIF
ncbi:MAG: hypothetical protein JXA99_13515 [Candidatus Lokiarchaeota archaeon]|nr:hypothetical protein [Candidatus Lokiarchaeota archaeon]